VYLRTTGTGLTQTYRRRQTRLPSTLPVDKPDTVFAVVIREIPKIHRQANPSRRESCLEESVAMSIDSEEFAIQSSSDDRRA